MAIPLALIAVIVTVDLAPEPDIHLGPLLIVAPAITASFAGPWLVAAVGLLTVAGEVVTSIGVEEQDRNAQIAAVVLVSAFIVFFSLLRDRRGRELSQVRLVSDTVQRVLMRPLPDRIGPLRISSLYLTAEREAQIGGDLYAAARIDGGTRLIIGDVRGKGLAAVDTTAQILGAFRAAAHQRALLPDLLVFLDDVACVEAARPGEPDSHSQECFVTAAVLDIHDSGASIHVINRGHPPPLLLRGGQVTELRASHPAPPLGLGALVPAGHDVDTFAYEPGDVLLLYTDGVIEARDATGTFYPLAERVAAWPEREPASLVEHLHDDLLAYAGGRLDDDVAVVAVERLG
ncbi:PP2C family protein-serine/threonine phosphatase [Actinomadura sp. DC4]|uniref:PP2C family protein-serine/threonine phosphatase n=1 Tax=Actinomadura sp. DC4 TaxID=3055069 RepID=UPI0025B25B8B|nr:PP2C family protein-serine/threonine phosphatase [Actinomadura sp. DC4]MDN3354338.1 PP2C family protein-serine/threonine phosphatase [Actinomadura sp. DC4]